MNIQVIQYEAPTTEEKDMTFSLWQAPRAIDDFDINFIDLSDENMWTAREASLGEIDSKADLATVRQMVDNSRKAKVVFVLPQNVQYTYGTKYANPYRSMLKDVIDEVQRKIFYAIIPFNSLAHISVVYARTETQIGGNKIGSDFYLDTIYPAVTKSDRSEKITTIMLNSRIYVTTLDIIQASDIKLFVSSILEKPQHEGAPEWMNQIQFYDDIIQQNTIRTCKKEIEKANKRISDAKIRLEENSRIKSILYTNGNSLVAVVFEILEKLLDCDLSEFVDKKKEDFLIKKPSCTFIGEIKGVTSNVKHEHISQIELHYRGYLDRLEDEGISESVKQLLIINPFRNKPLDQREPVHKEQITLAERNGCLIIETHTLMRMYENYCLGLLTAQRCEEIFANVQVY